MSRFLAATLGRFSPRYRTFDQWTKLYWEILESRGLDPKTLANRRNNLRYLTTALGERTISSIRPHEIARITRSLYEAHPYTARRVLIEARDSFGEAVAYGLTYTNPALAVRHQTIHIARKRLSLEQWRAIHAYAVENQPPWVAHMLVLALVSGQRRGDLQKMRFADAHDGYLFITQQKTGTHLRLPLALHLDAIDCSLERAIEDCHGYAPGDDYLLRKSTGQPLVPASLSARFETAREGALGIWTADGDPPSLHECRSLAERLYRKQHVDTKTLLGHKHQTMTDTYNDARGLDADEWKTLEL